MAAGRLCHEEPMNAAPRAGLDRVPVRLEDAALTDHGAA